MTADIQSAHQGNEIKPIKIMRMIRDNYRLHSRSISAGRRRVTLVRIFRQRGGGGGRGEEEEEGGGGEAEAED